MLLKLQITVNCYTMFIISPSDCYMCCSLLSHCHISCAYILWWCLVCIQYQLIKNITGSNDVMSCKYWVLISSHNGQVMIDLLVVAALQEKIIQWLSEQTQDLVTSKPENFPNFYKFDLIIPPKTPHTTWMFRPAPAVLKSTIIALNFWSSTSDNIIGLSLFLYQS